MSTLRKFVLPAFKQRFEASPSYADFAAPALAAVAVAVNTVDKRAAMDSKELSKSLGILSSRLVTAASRQTPDPAEVAAIASLPNPLKTSVGALNAAIKADESNTKLKVWRCVLQGAHPKEFGACAKAAARADPHDGTMFKHLLFSPPFEFKKGLPPPSMTGTSLNGVVSIEGFGTKTLGEWFSHGVQIDEFNVDVWQTVAECLAHVYEADLQVMSEHFSAKAEEELRHAKNDDDRAEIQVRLIKEFQQAMPPHPTFSVDGQEFDCAMAAARCVQIRQMHITAFGEDVVSAAPVSLPAHSARAHYNDACKLLLTELEIGETATFDTFEKSPATGDLVVSGTRTVTPVALPGGEAKVLVDAEATQ